jgi:hypothetical protein
MGRRRILLYLLVDKGRGRNSLGATDITRCTYLPKISTSDFPKHEILILILELQEQCLPRRAPDGELLRCARA